MPTARELAQLLSTPYFNKALEFSPTGEFFIQLPNGQSAKIRRRTDIAGDGIGKERGYEIEISPNPVAAIADAGYDATTAAAAAIAENIKAILPSINVTTLEDLINRYIASLTGLDGIIDAAATAAATATAAAAAAAVPPVNYHDEYTATILADTTLTNLPGFDAKGFKDAVHNASVAYAISAQDVVAKSALENAVKAAARKSAGIEGIIRSALGAAAEGQEELIQKAVSVSNVANIIAEKAAAAAAAAGVPAVEKSPTFYTVKTKEEQNKLISQHGATKGAGDDYRSSVGSATVINAAIDGSDNLTNHFLTIHQTLTAQFSHVEEFMNKLRAPATFLTKLFFKSLDFDLESATGLTNAMLNKCKEFYSQNGFTVDADGVFFLGGVRVFTISQNDETFDYELQPAEGFKSKLPDILKCAHKVQESFQAFINGSDEDRFSGAGDAISIDANKTLVKKAIAQSSFSKIHAITKDKITTIFNEALRIKTKATIKKGEMDDPDAQALAQSAKAAVTNDILIAAALRDIINKASQHAAGSINFFAQIEENDAFAGEQFEQFKNTRLGQLLFTNNAGFGEVIRDDVQNFQNLIKSIARDFEAESGITLGHAFSVVPNGGIDAIIPESEILQFKPDDISATPAEVTDLSNSGGLGAVIRVRDTKAVAAAQQIKNKVAKVIMHNCEDSVRGYGVNLIDGDDLQLGSLKAATDAALDSVVREVYTVANFQEKFNAINEAATTLGEAVTALNFAPVVNLPEYVALRRFENMDAFNVYIAEMRRVCTGGGAPKDVFELTKASFYAEHALKIVESNKAFNIAAHDQAVHILEAYNKVTRDCGDHDAAIAQIKAIAESLLKSYTDTFNKGDNISDSAYTLYYRVKAANDVAEALRLAPKLPGAGAGAGAGAARQTANLATANAIIAQYRQNIDAIDNINTANLKDLVENRTVQADIKRASEAVMQGAMIGVSKQVDDHVNKMALEIAKKEAGDAAAADVTTYHTLQAVKNLCEANGIAIDGTTGGDANYDILVLKNKIKDKIAASACENISAFCPEIKRDSVEFIARSRAVGDMVVDNFRVIHRIDAAAAAAVDAAVDAVSVDDSDYNKQALKAAKIAYEDAILGSEYSQIFDKFALRSDLPRRTLAGAIPFGDNLTDRKNYVERFVQLSGLSDITNPEQLAKMAAFVTKVAISPTDTFVPKINEESEIITEVFNKITEYVDSKATLYQIAASIASAYIKSKVPPLEKAGRDYVRNLLQNLADTKLGGAVVPLEAVPTPLAGYDKFLFLKEEVSAATHGLDISTKRNATDGSPEQVINPAYIRAISDTCGISTSIPDGILTYSVLVDEAGKIASSVGGVEKLGIISHIPRATTPAKDSAFYDAAISDSNTNNDSKFFAFISAALAISACKKGGLFSEVANFKLLIEKVNSDISDAEKAAALTTILISTLEAARKNSRISEAELQDFAKFFVDYCKDVNAALDILPIVKRIKISTSGGLGVIDETLKIINDSQRSGIVRDRRPVAEPITRQIETADQSLRRLKAVRYRNSAGDLDRLAPVVKNQIIADLSSISTSSLQNLDPLLKHDILNSFGDLKNANDKVRFWNLINKDPKKIAALFVGLPKAANHPAYSLTMEHFVRHVQGFDTAVRNNNGIISLFSGIDNNPTTNDNVFDSFFGLDANKKAAILADQAAGSSIMNIALALHEGSAAVLASLREFEAHQIMAIHPDAMAALADNQAVANNVVLEILNVEMAAADAANPQPDDYAKTTALLKKLGNPAAGNAIAAAFAAVHEGGALKISVDQRAVILSNDDAAKRIVKATKASDEAEAEAAPDYTKTVALFADLTVDQIDGVSKEAREILADGDGNAAKAVLNGFDDIEKTANFVIFEDVSAGEWELIPNMASLATAKFVSGAWNKLDMLNNNFPGWCVMAAASAADALGDGHTNIINLLTGIDVSAVNPNADFVDSIVNLTPDQKNAIFRDKNAATSIFGVVLKDGAIKFNDNPSGIDHYKATTDLLSLTDPAAIQQIPVAIRVEILKKVPLDLFLTIDGVTGEQHHIIADRILINLMYGLDAAQVGEINAVGGKIAAIADFNVIKLPGARNTATTLETLVATAGAGAGGGGALAAFDLVAFQANIVGIMGVAPISIAALTTALIVGRDGDGTTTAGHRDAIKNLTPDVRIQIINAVAEKEADLAVFKVAAGGNHQNALNIIDDLFNGLIHGNDHRSGQANAAAAGGAAAIIDIGTSRKSIKKFNTALDRIINDGEFSRTAHANAGDADHAAMKVGAKTLAEAIVKRKLAAALGGGDASTVVDAGYELAKGLIATGLRLDGTAVIETNPVNAIFNANDPIAMIKAIRNQNTSLDMTAPVAAGGDDNNIINAAKDRIKAVAMAIILSKCTENGALIERDAAAVGGGDTRGAIGLIDAAADADAAAGWVAHAKTLINRMFRGAGDERDGAGNKRPATVFRARDAHPLINTAALSVS